LCGQLLSGGQMTVDYSPHARSPLVTNRMEAHVDFDAIPLIDVAPLFGSDDVATRQCAAAIHQASKNVGFFYVANHGISRDLIRATYMAAKYFFAQSDETKRTILINDAHRGYVPFAQTTLSPTTSLSKSKLADLKESFNFAYPFAADDPEVRAGKPLIGVNQWPPEEAAWKSVAEDYYAAIFELGQRILEAFAIALGTHRDFFRQRYRRPLVRCRLLHYPPQPPDASDEQFGCAPHTDYGCITILWQDDVGGLEVMNRAGRWVAAPYIDDAFVVNIGDMLALWSNDLYVSTPHRVTNRSGRERYSIPIFYDPDFDTVVECLPNCSTAENPAKYAPIVAGEYITAKYDASYAYRKKAT
jgi:isopenicillin N synthase-like dioxygenase